MPSCCCHCNPSLASDSPSASEIEEHTQEGVIGTIIIHEEGQSELSEGHRHVQFLICMQSRNTRDY